MIWPSKRIDAMSIKAYYVTFSRRAEYHPTTEWHFCLATELAVLDIPAS